MLSRDHDEEKSAERFRFPRRWNQVDESRRGLVLAWVAFTLTFGGARLVTWLIQIDTRDVGDISAGGTHLHHYLWGILLLAGGGDLRTRRPKPSRKNMDGHRVGHRTRAHRRRGLRY